MRKQFTLEVRPEHLERSIAAFRKNVWVGLSCNCPMAFALADKFPKEQRFWAQHGRGDGVPVSAHMFELTFGDDGMENYDLDENGARIIHAFDGLTYGQVLGGQYQYPFVTWDGPALPCTVTFTEYER